MSLENEIKEINQTVIVQRQSTEIFKQNYGERKISVIFQIFHKNKGNSTAIDRSF